MSKSNKIQSAYSSIVIFSKDRFFSVLRKNDIKCRNPLVKYYELGPRIIIYFKTKRKSHKLLLDLIAIEL